MQPWRFVVSYAHLDCQQIKSQTSSLRPFFPFCSHFDYENNLESSAEFEMVVNLTYYFIPLRKNISKQLSIAQEKTAENIKKIGANAHA